MDMSPTKIDGTAVELATRAARDALVNDSNLAWIRKSSLIERAYFRGLLEGLSAIAEEDALRKHLTQALLDTLWSRTADDTFPSTQLGQDFAALKQSLNAHNRSDQRAIEAIVRDIDQLDRNWRVCVEHTRTSISRIQSASVDLQLHPNHDPLDSEQANTRLRQIHDSVSRLSDTLRYMALLETDHDLARRLEGK